MRLQAQNTATSVATGSLALEFGHVVGGGSSGTSKPLRGGKPMPDLMAAWTARAGLTIELWLSNHSLARPNATATLLEAAPSGSVSIHVSNRTSGPVRDHWTAEFSVVLALSVSCGYLVACAPSSNRLSISAATCGRRWHFTHTRSPSNWRMGTGRTRASRSMIPAPSGSRCLACTNLRRCSTPVQAL